MCNRWSGRATALVRFTMARHTSERQHNVLTFVAGDERFTELRGAELLRHLIPHCTQLFSEGGRSMALEVVRDRALSYPTHLHNRGSVRW